MIGGIAATACADAAAICCRRSLLAGVSSSRGIGLAMQN